MSCSCHKRTGHHTNTKRQRGVYRQTPSLARRVRALQGRVAPTLGAAPSTPTRRASKGSGDPLAGASGWYGLCAIRAFGALTLLLQGGRIGLSRPLLQLLLGRFRDTVCGEPEFLEQVFEWGRSAEGSHANALAA